MPQKLINVGSVPNGEAGDPIRVAFNKCNDNFSELFGKSSNVNVVEVVDGSLSNQDKVLTFSVNGTVYYIQAKTTKD